MSDDPIDYQVVRRRLVRLISEELAALYPGIKAQDVAQAIGQAVQDVRAAPPSRQITARDVPSATAVRRSAARGRAGGKWAEVAERLGPGEGEYWEGVTEATARSAKASVAQIHPREEREYGPGYRGSAMELHHRQRRLPGTDLCEMWIWRGAEERGKLDRGRRTDRGGSGARA